MAGGSEIAADQVSHRRLVEALAGLLTSLRARDFDVGTEQYLTACDLVLCFAAKGPLPSEKELRASLAGIFCTSPEEQADFPKVFDPWYHQLTGASSPEEPTPPPNPPGVDWLRNYSDERRYAWVLAGVAVTVLAWILLSIVDWCIIRSDCPPPPVIPREGPVPTGSQGIWARQYPEPVISSAVQSPGWMTPIRNLWIVPAAWWGIWFISHILPTRIITSRRSQQNGEAGQLDALRVRAPGDLFKSSELSETWRYLRRSRTMPSKSLDEQVTVDRTLDAGGYFLPVYRDRQVPPAYLLLIDRRHSEDLAAMIASELSAALRRENIQFESFEFRQDPRYCTPVGEFAVERGPAALAGIYRDHDLFLFGDREVLFDPKTGKPWPWIQEFDSYEKKYLLTTEPVYRGDQCNPALRATGFQELPLISKGLQQLPVKWELEETVDAGDHSFPPRLVGNPLSWLKERNLTRATLREMLQDLEKYLGSDGFLLLCATATYPGLYWHLTRALDMQLGLPQNEQVHRLRRLSRLPWHRHGRMPDFLRIELLQSLSRKQRRRISDAFHALILFHHGNHGPLHSPVPVPDWMGRRADLHQMIQLSERYSPLGDRMFADVVCGRKPRAHQSRGLTWWAPRFQPQSWWGFVGPLLTGLAIVPAVIWGNVWLWESWSELRTHSQIVSAMKEAHRQVHVDIHVDQVYLEPLFTALKSSLVTWGFLESNLYQRDRLPLSEQGCNSSSQNGQRYNVTQPLLKSKRPCVIYKPGLEAVAKVIAGRISYLYYGEVGMVLTTNAELLQKEDVRIELIGRPQGFRDELAMR